MRMKFTISFLVTIIENLLLNRHFNESCSRINNKSDWRANRFCFLEEKFNCAIGSF